MTNFGGGDPQSVNDLHAASDVDAGPLSQHHTLGKSNTQSAPGSHAHQGADSAILNVQDLLPPTGSTQGDILVAGIGSPPLDIGHVVLGNSGEMLVAEPLVTPGPRWVPAPGMIAPVRAVATANINTLAPGAGLTVDGVVLGANDRVLLTGQTVPAENGPYIYQGAVAMIRAREVALSQNAGIQVNITEGTLYAQSTWRNTNIGAITVGSTAQTWKMSVWKRIGARVRRVAVQAIPSNVVTAIAFDTAEENVGNYITVTSGTLTVPAGLDGEYNATLWVNAQAVEGAFHGNRNYIGIAVTSAQSTYPANFRTKIDAVEDQAVCNITGFPLAAGDTVQAVYFQDTGVNQNVAGAWFSLHLVGR